MAGTYNEIYNLIQGKQLDLAEAKLNALPNQDDKWHFLYSELFMRKNWFDSAKMHLEKAAALNPKQSLYADTLAKLMGRGHYYSNDYNQRGYRRRRSGCACCCGECCDCDCCEFSCCDLICLDSLCECAGGDLISCI